MAKLTEQDNYRIWAETKNYLFEFFRYKDMLLDGKYNNIPLEPER